MPLEHASIERVLDAIMFLSLSLSSFLAPARASTLIKRKSVIPLLKTRGDTTDGKFAVLGKRMENLCQSLDGQRASVVSRFDHSFISSARETDNARNSIISNRNVTRLQRRRGGPEGGNRAARSAASAFRTRSRQFQISFSSCVFR